ncbi:MAG: hypothetical protein HY266_08350 [Deltaproteobacteria bacterium]|nr:hypothetical protein [Deltaproteobacteria bacterium]
MVKKGVEEWLLKADKDLYSMNIISNQKGASIIAVIAIMLILAVMGAALVSLVTTGSDVSVNQLQSEQALYIAEGGLQYAVKTNNFPNYAVASKPLGGGSFTTTVPTVTTDPGVTSPLPTLNVSSTDWFIPNPGDSPNYWIMLCGVTGNPTPDLTSSNTCEKISFTSKTATTFTTGTRGRDSTVAAAHPATSVVLMYSWDTTKTTTIATRDLARADKCTTAATTICVASTANFADAGFIRINDGTEDNIEDVFYSGIGSSTGACGGTCTACLGTNGCTRRAYDGDKKGTIKHLAGTTIWQSEITVIPESTGVISGAQRVVQDTVKPLY